MTAQVQILNKILKTGDFSMVILNNLDESYFFNYQAEFRYIKNHYDTFHITPDRETFGSAFPDFDWINVTEPDNYLIGQLLKDYNASYIAIRFNKVKKLIEDNKIDEAVEYFKKSADEIRPAVAMTCTNLLTDVSRYEHYRDRALGKGQQYIKTGFHELDKEIGGIDPENENMVIAARTGIGKSWTLIKMAVAASQQGLTVGIYSGEMTTDKVGYRFDTLLGGINNKAITRGDPIVMQQYKTYIDTLANNSGLGAIKVLTPADMGGQATVGALRTFVEREKLQILFIDQYSLLEDTSHAKAMWERVGNISKDIKNLQVLTQIPVISVSQMNRTKAEDGGEGKGKQQDTTQIGLSDRIGQDATVVIMLDRDKDMGTLTLNVVKARDGGDGRKFTYKADFNTGEFKYIDENPDDNAAAELAKSYETAVVELPEVEETPNIFADFQADFGM